MALGVELFAPAPDGRAVSFHQEEEMARLALKAVAAVVAVSLAACSDGPVQPGDLTVSPNLAVAGSGADDVVAGEVIVKLKPGADLAEVGRKFTLPIFS